MLDQMIQTVNQTAISLDYDGTNWTSGVVIINLDWSNNIQLTMGELELKLQPWLASEKCNQLVQI